MIDFRTYIRIELSSMWCSIYKVKVARHGLTRPPLPAIEDVARELHGPPGWYGSIGWECVSSIPEDYAKI